MVNSRMGLLSNNSILLLSEAFKNQRLMRLVYYPYRRPFADTLDDVTVKDVFDPDANIMMISPLPFSEQVPEDQSCELRIHFPIGILSEDGAIAQTQVYFHFIYHNNLSLINDSDGSPKIRVYEVLNEIIKTYHGRSIGTLGTISFGEGKPPFNRSSFRYISTGNVMYGAYELSANMMTL